MLLPKTHGNINIVFIHGTLPERTGFQGFVLRISGRYIVLDVLSLLRSLVLFLLRYSYFLLLIVR